MLRKVITLATALLLLGASVPGSGRPFTVDDLLRTENFGSVLFDPHGHWLVFQQFAPFLDMSRFDMLGRTNVLRSRLYRVDLAAPTRAVPLLPDARSGTVAYGFSPDGTRLAVGRLSRERWQLGVVTMATGGVRWFDLPPDYSPFYATLGWISNEALVAIANPAGERPWWLRADSLPADTLPQRWAATRSGTAPAVTVIGSGRFLAMNDQGPDNRLMLVNVLSGVTTELAVGHFLSIDLAPDRTSLALIERGRVAPLRADRPASQIDWPFRRTMSIYDLHRRELSRPCPDCDLLGPAAWSPDSRQLAFYARRGDEDWSHASLFKTAAQHRSVVRLDRITAKIEQFPDGSAHAAFAWRGSSLLLFGRPAEEPDHRAEWYALGSGRHAHALTSGLADVSPNLVAIRGCATAMKSDEGIWCLDDPRPRRIAGSSVSISNGFPVSWHITSGMMTFDGDVLPGRELAIKGDRVERVDVAPTGRAATVQSAARGGVKTLAMVTPSRIVAVARVNLRLREVEPAVAIPLHHLLPDGRKVTSWLYLPRWARSSEKHPLVVIPYPGQSYGAAPPAGAGPAGERFDANVQLIAAHGYAVLLPSLPVDPRATVQSSSFVADVGSAVDAAVAIGVADPDRIALWGHSYGAYTVAMMVAHTCRYATAIASAGLYDLGAAVGTFGPTMRLAPERGVPIGLQYAWAETGQGGLGVAPWRDPARYVAASPVYQADRISTPMLIIAADRDVSPMQQAEELFSALFRQNKDAELVTYWGEGHVIGSPANVRDLYRRAFTWLDKTLALPQAGRCTTAAASPGAAARLGPSAR